MPDKDKQGDKKEKKVRLERTISRKSVFQTNHLWIDVEAMTCGNLTVSEVVDGAAVGQCATLSASDIMALPSYTKFVRDLKQALGTKIKASVPDAKEVDILEEEPKEESEVSSEPSSQ